MLAMSLVLSGCMAAATAGMYALSGANAAYVVGSEVRTHSDATYEFRIKRKDPDSRSVDTIRRAKTLALYPYRDGSDGRSIDEFRENTDMVVISSTKTIEWAEKNKVPALKEMPSNEKTETMGRVARAVGADIGLLVIPKKTDVAVNASFGATVNLTGSFTSYIVDGKSGTVLWVEEQELVVQSGGAKPPDGKEINRIARKAIASRIMDLRLGREPTVGKVG